MPANSFAQFLDQLTSPVLRAVAGHWDTARGDKLIPSWADLSSDALAPHFKHLWGFKYDPLMNEFRGALAGSHVKEWLGANFWGARLEDIHPPHVVGAAHEFLKTVLATPAAGRCSQGLFIMGERVIPGERIALPIAEDGLNGDGVLGVSDYDYVPVTGPVELRFEAMEWFGL